MIRWILDNERYDAHFLSRPTLKAATDAGEAAFCNATHLVCLTGAAQGKILRMEQGMVQQAKMMLLRSDLRKTSSSSR